MLPRLLLSPALRAAILQADYCCIAYVRRYGSVYAAFPYGGGGEVLDLGVKLLKA